MIPSLRLTVVMTHPVQYYAPWFRHITAQCKDVELTVLYATQPTPEQQGVGFGQSFVWDTSLMEGYDFKVIQQGKLGDNVHSDKFWGLNVTGIGAAIKASQPDVVLISGWHSITLIRALWACRRLRIPVLYR